MTKEDFEQQINVLVPCPDPDTTTDLFVFGQELGEESEYGSLRDLLNSLRLVSRYFDAEITQEVYEIIQYDAMLPDEMIAAAFCLASDDCSSRQLMRMADSGELMCFYMPKDAGELSPPAVCTVRENGKALTRYTTHFGSFDPEAALRLAQEYAQERTATVTDALLLLTVDMTVNPSSRAEKLLLHGDREEDMVAKLNASFNRYPALAARVTFDADRSQVTVEYNPLWLELRQKQEPGQHGMELKP